MSSAPSTHGTHSVHHDKRAYVRIGAEYDIAPVIVSELGRKAIEAKEVAYCMSIPYLFLESQLCPIFRRSCLSAMYVLCLVLLSRAIPSHLFPIHSSFYSYYHQQGKQNPTSNYSFNINTLITD